MSSGAKAAKAQASAGASAGASARASESSVNKLLMKSMRGGQAIQSAADTSAVENRMMEERLQQRQREQLQRRQQERLQRRQQEQLQQRPDDFQKRFDALYEKPRQGALKASQEPTTVRPPPKPQRKKLSPTIPVGKKGATLQPTTMGKGVGGGVKASLKFK